MKSATRAFLLMGVAAVAVQARAAVFQYAVPVPVGDGKPPATAYLWLPSEADAIRGVIIGGKTLIEAELAKDETVRQACRDEKLALVLVTAGLMGFDVQKTLDDLAKVSGYGELSVAPVMPVGHSAGGPQAKALAYKVASRCFGLIQFRGGIPDREGPGDAGALAGIPCLVAIGQFDEFWGMMRNGAGVEPWEKMRDLCLKYRGGGEDRLVSMLVEPGAGHFAWSDRQAAFVSLFIRKAARARIPAAWPKDAREPVALSRVDPRSGWLTDSPVRGDGKLAPYDEYAGSRTQAFWHVDGELAKACVAFHANGFGKKDQFIVWKDPYWVDAGVRNFITETKWVGDGRTIELHPAYGSTYPANTNGPGPRWAEAAKPVGNCGAPIQVRCFSGPGEAVGPNTVRIKYDALTSTDGKLYVLGFSPGNEEYRYTEGIAIFRSIPRNGRGPAQKLTFPAIANVKAGSGPVELCATSDANLPVEYYVAHGPATVSGNRLSLAEVPARAAYPIQVKVVAYQTGSGVEPFVQTASPVEQVFLVESGKTP